MHLHFTQSLEPLQGAGLGAAALGLHQGFLETGGESRLVTTRSADFGIEWPAVTQFVRKGPSKAFYAPGIRSVGSELIEAAEVVHGHGLYVYPNFVFGRLCRAKAKPLVYHIQGFFDPWILARSRLKKKLAHLVFEDRNFAHVSWWRAVSRKEEEQARIVGVKAPVEVIPNGVHLPPVRTEAEIGEMRQRFPKRRDRRVVFLSRIHPKKGLDLFFEAWSGLEGQLADRWEIAVFGPDEGGHRADVERLVGDLGMDEQVRFFGSVFGEAKEAAYRSADLFVLPSRSEGFPMAVLEAASYGLPVVQTNECNFPELTAAEGAWECEPEVESLRVVLRAALEVDDAERIERGRRGRDLVARNYQWSAIAARVGEVCGEFC